MKASDEFRVEEQPRFGIVAYCDDVDLADEFEDFLSEQTYTHFDLGFDQGRTAFFFGRASSREAVEALIEQFQRSRQHP